LPHRRRVTARRILFVLHDLPLGGTERIALRLANRWAAMGREVTLFCGHAEGPLKPMVGAGVDLVECDPPIPRGRGSRRRLGKALAAFVAQGDFDLLFIPGNFHWRVLPPVSRLSHRPAVVAQLSAPLVRYDRGRLRQAVFNWTMRRWLAGADAAVSLSDAMSAEADRILGRRLTTRLPLPALEDDAPAPLPIPDNRLIVAAGRLVPEKGFDVAIRAFARLDDPAARLRILGEGPAHERLAALARELGVAERVELAGFVPDIRPHLDQARLFVLSSWFEGYGAVLVEALAAGRPAVATNCSPSVAELVAPRDPEAVVPTGDEAAMARAFRHVLDAPKPDPRALAATVAEYRLGPVSAAYLDLFDRVAEGASGRRI
jgi:glycosyltransferase involved in cell wall biosynthesis